MKKTLSKTATFAEVSWCLEDMDTLLRWDFPELSWSDEAKIKFLERNERKIEEAMISIGWDVIRDLFVEELSPEEKIFS